MLFITFCKVTVKILYISSQFFSAVTEFQAYQCSTLSFKLSQRKKSDDKQHFNPVIAGATSTTLYRCHGRVNEKATSKKQNKSLLNRGYTLYYFPFLTFNFFASFTLESLESSVMLENVTKSTVARARTCLANSRDQLKIIVFNP